MSKYSSVGRKGDESKRTAMLAIYKKHGNPPDAELSALIIFTPIMFVVVVVEIIYLFF
jgi:hypothetical protein